MGVGAYGSEADASCPAAAAAFVAPAPAVGPSVRAMLCVAPISMAQRIREYYWNDRNELALVSLGGLLVSTAQRQEAGAAKSGHVRHGFTVVDHLRAETR